MLDRFNRDITYIRISVTDRCNLRCYYCMPSEGVKLKKAHEILSYEQIIDIVRVAAKLGIQKVRLTGGEPLIRKDVWSLIGLLKHISGIQEVSLTTNGVLLSEKAIQLKQVGLNRINISLDTLDPWKYRELTKGGNIQNVLDGIASVLKAGFKNTKINMVIIPGVNTDEVEEMAAFCHDKGIILQRINHYSLENRKSSHPRYETERPLSCEDCNRIRLTADGKLKPCLFSDLEIPVDLNNIAASIVKTILIKPKSGYKCTVRGNWEIGG